MSDWNLEQLKKWDDTIVKLAKSHDLDWYPINYEVCDYYSMIDTESQYSVKTGAPL